MSYDEDEVLSDSTFSLNGEDPFEEDPLEEPIDEPVTDDFKFDEEEPEAL
jgi:hypothetical protein